MSDPGLTRTLGEFVSGLRYGDVPAAAWDTVRAGFTDCVATMIAAARNPSCKL